MIQKCIHDDFELDLSGYEINIIEENQWFTDGIFTKYTFPFEVNLDEELNQKFGQLLDVNIANPVSIYNVIYFFDDTHEDAVLEVVEIIDRLAIIELRYGLDKLPSWDKKLSELPLEVTQLAESLFVHGVNIINKTYPAVNYNFVQVHTDSFDNQTPRWNGFQNIINNYDGSNFLINEFDDGEDVVLNRNIMIPMPYFLHVLNAGFQDAGYTLNGDVLTDPEFLKMLFFKETEEYINASIDGEEYSTLIDSYDALVDVEYKYGFLNLSKATRQLGVYSDTYAFAQPGRYKISGVVYLRRNFSDAKAEIIFKGQNVASFYQDYIRQNGVSERVRYIDVNIDVEDIANLVTFTNRQIINAVVNEQTVYDAPLWDLTITPLAIFDVNGELVPPVVTIDKIDLRKCVPDITFGDFVKVLKNWKNMEMRIDGDQVYMDYIEPKLDIDTAIDLSAYNQRVPRRQLKQGESFLLQFKNIDNAEYNPLPVFYNVDGIENTGFVTNDSTNEITIDAVPLPLVLRGDVQTALAVDKGDSNIAAVMYAGAQGILNLAESPEEMMVPRTYEKHWSRWLNFRLRSQSFTTNFNALGIQLKLLKIDSTVFMYNNYYLVRVLNRTTIPRTELINYELELDSLK